MLSRDPKNAEPIPLRTTEFDLTMTILHSATDNKDVQSRVRMFCEWMGDDQPWYEPDLAAYRDHLLAEGKAPATVSAHLSSVRGAYCRHISDNSTRQMLYGALAPRGAPPADQKAFVDELITRVENAIRPEAAPVEVTEHQDEPDSAQLRLTRAQAEALMGAPGVDTIKGVRDTAIIALLLCTGIREGELCNLDVADLRQELGGELALHVRDGKGSKARLVPYGELDWCLAIVQKWLEKAGIDDGPVFRGLYKGGSLRPGRLSVRAVGYILPEYPIAVNGESVEVKPHDCRRTYAKLMYESGADLLAIKDNLGHKDVKTTLGYIGVQDASRRRPKAIYSFNLVALAEA